MSVFLESLSKIINIINPVLLFVVFISIISFLSYLRVKIDGFFGDIKDISKNLERMADNDKNNTEGFYR